MVEIKEAFVPSFTSVMIIERNADLRHILRHVFEDRGYLTWTCPIPEIANSIFDAIQPNFVILDLDYEGTDCMQMLDDWLKHTPMTRVIVDSASPSRLEEAKKRGAKDCLAKPFQLGPLFQILDGVKNVA